MLDLTRLTTSVLPIAHHSHVSIGRLGISRYVSRINSMSEISNRRTHVVSLYKNANGFAPRAAEG